MLLRSLLLPPGELASATGWRVEPRGVCQGDRCVLHPGERSVAHFKKAQLLQPDNWTYRRQAWALVGEDRDRLYGTDWLSEVKKVGAESYYAALELCSADPPAAPRS